MSFRSSLFWTIVATVATIAALERGTRIAATVVADRVDVRVEARLDDAVADLEALLREAVEGLNRNDGDERVEREPEAVYAPVPDGPELVEALPTAERGPGWASRSVRLQDGAIVSVAVPLAWWERLGRNPGRLEWAIVPILVLVAFATASWATRRLTAPLRALSVVTERMADDRFVEPVPVPPGDDELARLARSFEQTREAIRTLLERERTFTRFVSHELRTPLSALKLHIERAQLPGVDPADVAPALERNVRRMEDVLNALLRLARATERGEARRAGDGASLRGLIADVTSAVDPAGQARLVVSDATPAGTFVRDAQLVRQALTNLIDNALRHGSRRAALRAWTDGDRLEVRIVDDGPGVDEDTLRRLTEPFYRGRTDSSGLGLGLALVATIADALQGELILRNRDAGFEAALRLPGIVDTATADDPGVVDRT